MRIQTCLALVTRHRGTAHHPAEKTQEGFCGPSAGEELVSQQETAGRLDVPRSIESHVEGLPWQWQTAGRSAIDEPHGNDTPTARFLAFTACASQRISFRRPSWRHVASNRARRRGLETVTEVDSRVKIEAPLRPMPDAWPEWGNSREYCDAEFCVAGAALDRILLRTAGPACFDCRAPWRPRRAKRAAVSDSPHWLTADAPTRLAPERNARGSAPHPVGGAAGPVGEPRNS